MNSGNDMNVIHAASVHHSLHHETTATNVGTKGFPAKNFREFIGRLSGCALDIFVFLKYSRRGVVYKWQQKHQK